MSNGAWQNDEECRGTLLIVDGHAYAYRAFHAIRQLASPSGAPTNAIYGFVKMLGKLRVRLGPTHVLVVWDGGLAAERLSALPEYKAQRPPMPAGLEAQLDELAEYLAAAGMASSCRDGVEADDWIATVARHALAAGLAVVVASSDKDFMQLLDRPRVGLFNPNDKTEAVWGPEQVRAKTGVEPAQIVDWLSLVGDAVDNIPGVAGVGAKTAAELLRQFGSIAALLDRLDEVRSDKLRLALREADATLQRNRQLIRLRDDLPGKVCLDELVPRPADTERLAALYTRWGFRSLLAQLEAERVPQGNLF